LNLKVFEDQIREQIIFLNGNEVNWRWFCEFRHLDCFLERVEEFNLKLVFKKLHFLLKKAANRFCGIGNEVLGLTKN
jgi:hypothetical protein